MAGESAQQKADIAANLAAQKAAIAEASAARKAAIDADTAKERAAIASAAAEQKAAIASRLAQEKSVQAAILAAQQNAAAVGAAFDKRRHEESLALIKQETSLKEAEIKRQGALELEQLKQVDRARRADEKKKEKKPDATFGEGLLKNIFPFTEQLKSAAGQGALAGSLITGGAGLLAEGAIQLSDAAAAIARSAAGLVEAGVKLSIEQTSKKEVQSAIFKQIGGDYEATVDLALNFGLDESDVVEQTKRLLHAGFSKKRIPALIKLKTSLDLEGYDGDAVLKKLETIKLEPKVKSKDVDGLAKLGIDTKKVYAELAKEIGTSVPIAMAKVKSGAVDSAKVISAITKVGASGSGPLDALANSVPSLASKVRGQFLRLFDSVDLSPIKDFLKNVSGALEGPGGQALKTSITDLFSSLNHAVLDQFKGEEGKAKLTKVFTGIASVIRDVAGVVKDLAPVLTLLGTAIAKTGDDSIGGQLALGAFEGSLLGIVPGLSETIDFIRLVIVSVETVSDVFDSLSSTLDGVSFDSVIASAEALIDEFLGTGIDIGKSLVEGLVQGLDGGTSAAISAASAMASNALAAAKQALGVASPSVEFAKIGHFSVEGLAKGFAANDNSTVAAGDLASRALGAAQAVVGASGAPGGAGGPGGSGGAGGPQIVINIQLGAGASPAAAQALAQQLPAIEAMVRRSVRDALEGRAA